jgi:hypothetical protein
MPDLALEPTADSLLPVGLGPLCTSESRSGSRRRDRCDNPP